MQKINTVLRIFGDERKPEDPQTLASILHKVKTVIKSRGQWGGKASSRETIQGEGQSVRFATKTRASVN